MSNNWRKLENENGFPYYYNEATKTQQWDHPKFTDIKQRIDDCNYVKHAKYRVALKFRILQQSLYMEEIPLNIISGVFERHRLGMNESTLCLESCDLEAVLSDIYFAANKQNHTNIDIDYASELMQNLLFNIYDKDRQGKIQVSSTKLLLAILSNSNSSEINNYFFKICSDHNNCVTRLRLQMFLHKLVDISVFMHEDVSYGQHLISPSIENCFSNNPGLVGITEGSFIGWLEKEPQFLSWIPVLRRLKQSESVIHSVKCSSCKTTPLMGLKYRCTKCTRFTQCQRCFFSGRLTNSHKLTHLMREYSTATDSKEISHNFIKKIFGILPCALKLNETNISLVESKPLEINYLTKPLNNDLFNLSSLSSPHTQLQTIIKQLESQNRELQQILLIGSHNENEIRKYLEKHRVNISAQIHKLKILKDYLDEDEKKLVIDYNIQSTPMVKNANYPQNNQFDFLSPITQSYVINNDTTNQQQQQQPYSINDISTWIGGQSSVTVTNEFKKKSPVRELHNDLDDALAKLQQILANNFSLDESLCNIDNNHLKNAVSEVEGVLTSIIDNVESSRASSAIPLTKFND